jgi:hypothetical protein
MAMAISAKLADNLPMAASLRMAALEVRPGVPQIDFKEEWADANT